MANIAECPTCGWQTRELSADEVDLVNEGRLRCSGECQAHAAVNVPSSFPPKLRMITPVEKEK